MWQNVGVSAASCFEFVFCVLFGRFWFWFLAAPFKNSFGSRALVSCYKEFSICKLPNSFHSDSSACTRSFLRVPFPTSTLPVLFYSGPSTVPITIASECLWAVRVSLLLLGLNCVVGDVFCLVLPPCRASTSRVAKGRESALLALCLVTPMCTC